MEQKNNTSLVLANAQEKFEIACREINAIQSVEDFGKAFIAVGVVKMLREALSNEVMKEVFMPLMNTKIGFLTDRTGKPNSKGQVKPLYSIDIVRDAIIDAVSIGLLPTGNQMNIISEKMYPTKEGYTALLKKQTVKYYMNVGFDDGANASYAQIPVKINYEHAGDKNSFSIIATVKKDSFASHDALRGKAERRAKKTLYEYITGCDFGDADEDSSVTIKIIPKEEDKDINQKKDGLRSNPQQGKIDLP